MNKKYEEIINKWLILDKYSDKSYGFELQHLKPKFITTAYEEDKQLPTIPVPVIIEDTLVIDMKYPITSKDIQPYDRIVEKISTRGNGKLLLGLAKLHDEDKVDGLRGLYKPLVNFYRDVFIASLKRNLNLDVYDVRVLEAVIVGIYYDKLFDYDEETKISMMYKEYSHMKDFTYDELMFILSTKGEVVDRLTESFKNFSISPQLKNMDVSSIKESFSKIVFGTLVDLMEDAIDNHVTMLGLIEVAYTNIFLKKTLLAQTITNNKRNLDADEFVARVAMITRF